MIDLVVKGYVDSEIHRLDCEVSDVVEDVVDRFDGKLKELQKKIAELESRLSKLG